MNAYAQPTTPVSAVPTRRTGLAVLVALLRVEAAFALGATVLFSMLAGSGEAILDVAGVTNLRFAAGGTFLAAIFAYVAARGASRSRGWSYTMAALLQLAVALGVALGILVVGLQPALLAALGLAGALFVTLSLPSVRDALGQS